MLEGETVHTGTQMSRVYCSLPWNKSPPLNEYLQSRRWSVKQTSVKIVPPISISNDSGKDRSAKVAERTRRVVKARSQQRIRHGPLVSRGSEGSSKGPRAESERQQGRDEAGRDEDGR